MTREFLIEFDVITGIDSQTGMPHNPQTGANLSDDELQPYGWRSIGEATGGKFVNSSSVTVTAVHIKTNNAGDTFKVTPGSAGALFPTVWVKNDATEAYFAGGNVPVFGSHPDTGLFWMRVTGNSDDEIQQCDVQGVCPFTGQLNPPDPTGAGWTKILDARARLAPKWQTLFAACPSALRGIRIYGESPDGRLVAFIVRGELLLFDEGRRTVSTVSPRDTALSTVNRIVFENGSFLMLSHGAIVRKFDPASAKTTVVGSL